MKNVNDKELAAVIALPGPERYAYFVRNVADWEEIWTLRGSEGFVLVAGADKKELVPVWPHARFAEAWSAANRGDAQVVAIQLEQWLQKWTHGLKNDNRGVAVFPAPSGPGVAVAPERLHDDLLAECSQYE
jgi:Protein of unknown function (DUF2750)